MAQDFHTLRFKIHYIESLIKNNMPESAKFEAGQLFQIYEKADFDGVPIGLVKEIMGKAEEIRHDLKKTAFEAY